MSSRALAWAWIQEVKAGPKMVLVALADRADEDGYCFPGLNWIATKTGYSKDAVRRNIQRLAQLELLTVEMRKRSDGSNTSNEYQLSIPSDFAPLRPSKLQGGTSKLQGLHTPNYTFIEEEENKNKTPPTVAFVIPDWLDDETWEAYVEMRKKERHPLTDYAKNLIVRKLARFKMKGYNPQEILNTSIENGWRGVFEPRLEREQQRDGELSPKIQRMLRRGL